MPKDPATEIAVTASLVIEALEKAPGSSAAEIAEATGLGRSTVTRKLAELERVGLAIRTPGQREGSVRTPDQWSLAPKKPAAGAKSARGNSRHPSSTARKTGSADGSKSREKSTATADRLPRGELAKLVREYLDTHPGAHSPSAIASDLQRSAGAVANALVRLVDETEAVLIQVAPKRYQGAAPSRRKAKA